MARALGCGRRRPTRTSPTTTWRGSTAARSAACRQRDLDAAAGRSGCARSSTSSRTRPTSTAIVFPPRAQIRVTLKPRFGDADLAAFTRSATSTADDEQIIGRSRRNGRRTDSLVLRNPSRRSRAAFLVAYIDENARALDSRYDLSVRRVKRR